MSVGRNRHQISAKPLRWCWHGRCGLDHGGGIGCFYATGIAESKDSTYGGSTGWYQPRWSLVLSQTLREFFDVFCLAAFYFFRRIPSADMAPACAEEAFINFPELIRLHRVLQAPITTVDPDGWNAEMLAARALNKEHVKFLQEATVEMWHDWGSDAFNFFIVGKMASEQFSSVCIFLALHVTSLAYIGAFFFICGWLFDRSLFLCNMLFNRSKLDRLLSWLPVLARCRCTFLGAEMFLRVLWLLTLNAAFLNLPPEFTIVWEKHVSPFEIPSVSKWNPLPATVHSICCFCILLVLLFGLPDYAAARRAAEDEEEYPAAAVPEDRYQDPTCHLIGCICVFGLMTLLMIIYLQIVLRPMEMDPWKMGLWCGSLLVQIKITLEDALSPRAQQDLQVAFQADVLEESNVEDRYQAVRHVMHHWHRWVCSVKVTKM